MDVLSSCLVKDTRIAQLDSRIAYLTKKAVENSTHRDSYNRILATTQEERLALEKEFVQSNCTDLIEQKKTLENADILSTGFELSESDLIGKSNKQKNQLLLLGGGVLLLGLFIIIK